MSNDVMMSITTFIKTPQHAFFTALSHSLPLILSSLIKHTFAISWHFVSSSGTMIQIRFQHDKGGGYFFQNAPVIKSYPTISPSLPCCVQSLPFFVFISNDSLSLQFFAYIQLQPQNDVASYQFSKPLLPSVHFLSIFTAST